MAVFVSVENRIAEIGLDWPDVHNALGPDEARELRLAVEALGRRDDIGVIVMTATGGSFCSGGNLRAIVKLVGGDEQAVEETVYKEFQGLFRAIGNSPVPVLAAVDGAAVGLGADLALVADVTYVGQQGWLAQGWAALGLVPATGGALYVARKGGRQAVWRFLAAGRVNGPAAAELGIAVSVASAREAAFETATKLATIGNAALRALRHLSTIDDLQAHLDTALGYQKKFLTLQSFLEQANRILTKTPR